ncbi:MAG: hypothetical protein DIU71_00245 [Proteobacteria bacterium]|nr:MAG: hypothetical protein DIU71_00245 [Pseudomonadota bacterium]
MTRREQHRSTRTGWLRAAVLGANDGIVSTASLIIGVAAANVARGDIVIAAVAGLVAGAMSMAAGEYVSVSSQADAERADLELERREHSEDFEFERRELAAIYVGRGLDPALAYQVASQLMAHDPLGAHARDELGLSAARRARPLQAAATSAVAFSLGGSLPVLALLLAPPRGIVPVVGTASLVVLGLLGATAAWVGGARVLLGGVRVMVCSALAMALAAAVGVAFDIA